MHRNYTEFTEKFLGFLLRFLRHFCVFCVPVLRTIEIHFTARYPIEVARFV